MTSYGYEDCEREEQSVEEWLADPLVQEKLQEEFDEIVGDAIARTPEEDRILPDEGD